MRGKSGKQRTRNPKTPAIFCISLWSFDPAKLSKTICRVWVSKPVPSRDCTPFWLISGHFLDINLAGLVDGWNPGLKHKEFLKMSGDFPFKCRGLEDRFSNIRKIVPQKCKGKLWSKKQGLKL